MALFYHLFNAFFAFLFFSYFYLTVAKIYSYSFFAMFSAAVNDSVNVLLFFVTLSLFGAMNVLKQQKEKKEKEYQELRCEIVDRSKDLWKKEDQWGNRHIIFEMMKKNYDINLYHEKNKKQNFAASYCNLKDSFLIPFIF